MKSQNVIEICKIERDFDYPDIDDNTTQVKTWSKSNIKKIDRIKSKMWDNKFKKHRCLLKSLNKVKQEKDFRQKIGHWHEGSWVTTPRQLVHRDGRVPIPSTAKAVQHLSQMPRTWSHQLVSSGQPKDSQYKGQPCLIRDHVRYVHKRPIRPIGPQ